MAFAAWKSARFCRWQSAHFNKVSLHSLRLFALRKHIAGLRRGRKSIKANPGFHASNELTSFVVLVSCTVIIGSPLEERSLQAETEFLGMNEKICQHKININKQKENFSEKIFASGYLFDSLFLGESDMFLSFLKFRSHDLFTFGSS